MATIFPIRLATFCCAIVLLSGCSLQPTPEVATAEVKGRITLNGEALEGARVVFFSVERNPSIDQERRFSFGVTQADGSFELQFADNSPGAIVGKHKIVVSKLVSRISDDGQTQENMSDPPPRPKRELIPARYNRQTELTFEVVLPDATQSDDVSQNFAELNLTSDGAD